MKFFDDAANLRIAQPAQPAYFNTHFVGRMERSAMHRRHAATQFCTRDSIAARERCIALRSMHPASPLAALVNPLLARYFIAKPIAASGAFVVLPPPRVRA